MVKITNGINVFEVTSGAYEGIYRHQGYQIVSGKKEQEAFVAEGAPKEAEKSADEIFAEELQKKPISQWNKDEVKRFASVKGIDLAGTKSVNEAKEVIKKALNDEEE